VLDGDPAPLPKKGAEPPPKFSVHVHCSQTAGWIKTALGLGPGHIVLYGDPAHLPKKGAEPPLPIFGPFQLWPKGWMHQDATWYMEVGLSPGDFVLDGHPVPPQKGGKVPNFQPMYIVAKRLDGSRWHLAWRWALVQATLCYMGTQLPSLKRGQSSPIFAHLY